jgi:hypothetical protein
MPADLRPAVWWLSRAFMFGVFLAAGVLVVRTFPAKHTSIFPVWASLVVAYTSAGGGCLLYGLKSLAVLTSIVPVPTKPIVARLSVVFFLITALALFDRLVFGFPPSNWAARAGQVMTYAAFIGAIPIAFVMYGISTVALVGADISDAKNIERLINARRLLIRVLRALGSLVALAVFVIGVWAKVDKVLPASERLGESPLAVVTFGGTGALLVALLYVPAAVALQASSLQLSARMFPLNSGQTGAVEILDTVDKRLKLEKLLAADRGVTADLQASLVIFGPLIAGAVAALVGRF